MREMKAKKEAERQQAAVTRQDSQPVSYMSFLCQITIKTLYYIHHTSVKDWDLLLFRL